MTTEAFGRASKMIDYYRAVIKVSLGLDTEHFAAANEGKLWL